MFDVTEAKHRFGRLFQMTIGGTKYIYRLPTVKESSRIFRLFRESKNEMVEREILCCVVDPVCDWGKSPFRLTKQIAERILKSAKIFDDTGIKDAVVAANRYADELSGDDFGAQKLAVMQIFPGYTLEILDRMQVQDFFTLAVLAEKISGRPLFDYKALGISAKKGQPRKKPMPQTSQHTNYSDIELPKGTKQWIDQENLDRQAAEDSAAKLREHWNTLKQR
jgi:hypothetical protein